MFEAVAGRSARAGLGAAPAAGTVTAMTVSEFLAAFAAEAGAPVPTQEEIDALLEVASIAAHSSERLAAPLTCWIGGASGLTPAALLTIAERLAADGD